jgi:SNF2 family DNA or RNA helicase
MPRIFDNIELDLLPALKETLAVSERSDFCVGYFNLRGWRLIDSYVEKCSGKENDCCRVLIGMQKLPEQELRDLYSLTSRTEGIDQKEVKKLKLKLAEEFRQQLMVGAPTNEDEAGLRRLARQIKNNKVAVRLFLRYHLHAKLYLLYRTDFNNPITGYLGSSNLTLAGLSKQGELNIDVLDQDACKKLEKWFNDRWDDRWCVDISQELAEIIDQSWAREDLVPPYHIYLKIAYHLSQEARAGLCEFKLPSDLQGQLFDFQAAAVKIAAHHINKRKGVVIGDVVGLGKTLMATAIARIFQDDQSLETLIICPKNLTPMWEGYVSKYRLIAKVLPVSVAAKELPELRRYRLVIIDESHNLRNRDGQRFRAIQEYIAENESRVVLLTATPYNKTFLDLSTQLRLFIPEHEDIGIRPEALLRDIGETEFIRRHQAPLRSIAAFEKSEHIDDWRDLMRLYLVRRTRSFIKDNYADTDPENGRKYLVFADGRRSYFPDRIPRTLKFKLDDKDQADQYARLYSKEVVDLVNCLCLPRYGMKNHLTADADVQATPQEKFIIDDLSRAGKRLMGFCRTNLFKRLESSGSSFLLSVGRHIIRNYVYAYACENRLPLPLGTLDSEFYDSLTNDEDSDTLAAAQTLLDYAETNGDNGDDQSESTVIEQFSDDWFRLNAEKIYKTYSTKYKKRFKWIRSELFTDDLRSDLLSDAASLIELLKTSGKWEPQKDTKLNKLRELIAKKHPKEKIIVFSQFADTVRYLHNQLKNEVGALEMVTGQSDDPTAIAYRFSPKSNEKTISPEKELRVVLSTDVLSEGQNLQDCAIVVNYDLPWAIIRLVQRVGRIDRIGQTSENIFCYSFLPAEGVERIIRLRSRVRQRLAENGEVLGTDEQFFEDQNEEKALKDLYTENSGILDGEVDNEIDLASFAYQIWLNATKNDQALKKAVENLPDVVFSSRTHKQTQHQPDGVVVYVRTVEGNDALCYVDDKGKPVTESPLAVLKVAECAPDTPPRERHPRHHELVKKGVDLIVQDEKTVGGQLGRPSGARFRTYARLELYIKKLQDENSIFLTEELKRAFNDIYRFPLRSLAVDILNRQLRTGITDQALAELVVALREEDRLTLNQEEADQQEPRILCSLGLFGAEEGKTQE